VNHFIFILPGIRVVYPSNAQDAAGLLRTAIRCDDPVMFLEHKHFITKVIIEQLIQVRLYDSIWKSSNVVKEGSDATIVAWGALVQKSVDAAKKIEEETGKTIEIIDPRTLAPFDMEAVKTSH
jgi:2-oxoisovalerate dehydrogenase E1 component